MADENLRALRVGYVVERSSSASETFVAREILELQRQGVEVHIFRLDIEEGVAQRPDQAKEPAGAAAPEQDNGRFERTWDELRRRILERRGRPAGIRRALILALEHPSRAARRCLEEALVLAEKAEKLELRHLHAHAARNPAFMAMLASLVTGIPFSFTAHARDISAAGPPARQWGRQLRHAAFAVTVADSSTRHLTRTLGDRAASKIRLLPGAVDLEAARPAADRFTAAVPRILCVSRLVEKMGVDLLIDALDLMGKQRARFACTIVGEGAQEIDLRRRAVKAGLEDLVEFRREMSPQDLIRLLRGSDVLVLARRVVSEDDLDALPTILLEAMAAGIPCVATPVGGVAEIVQDSETGLLVEAEDPAALGAALLRLLEDPDLKRRLGDGGRLRAERMFNLKRNVAVLRGWFEEASLPREEMTAPPEAPAPSRRPRPSGWVPLRDLRT